MSLDVYLTDTKPTEVFAANITHNLNKMAEAAGIYLALWRPEELNIVLAGELIEPLTAGLDKLKSDPAKYAEYNPTNGWGDYNTLVKFVEQYLQACIEHPEAAVKAYR